ncbi:MAG: response regulator transcription factor [Flavobacteriaceae bacterium]|nr:response regulator transcription factor [Flavobacteriaceae bacterium]
MRVIIIEDEYLASKQLSKQINNSSFDIEIIAILESVKQAKKWFETNSCNLIFSDIHLGDGDSFEILENIETPIIFTTAHNQYAIKSFKLLAVDYLLKPYTKDNLYSAISKFTKMYNQNKLKTPIQNKQDTENLQERFLVKEGSKLISINIQEIAYFMAQGKLLFIFTHKGIGHLYDSTITKTEDRVPKASFLKVNRKYIVSAKSIKNIEKHSNNRMKLTLNPLLKNEEDVLVSSKNYSLFKKWLDQ